MRAGPRAQANKQEEVMETVLRARREQSEAREIAMAMEIQRQKAEYLR